MVHFVFVCGVWFFVVGGGFVLFLCVVKERLYERAYLLGLGVDR